MTTLVGTQSNFLHAVQELIELDYDAIEAYDAAIKRVQKVEYQKKLAEFKADHERHVKELSRFLQQHNEKAPSGPSTVKQWLAKGKVVVGNLVGDKAIIDAMISNECDTNKAYERMNAHKHQVPDVKAVLEKGLEDERRHKDWLESVK